MKVTYKLQIIIVLTIFLTLLSFRYDFVLQKKFQESYGFQSVDELEYISGAKNE